MLDDVDDVDDDDHSLATEVWLFMELALPWIRAGDCHRQWRIRRSQCAPLVEAGDAQFLVTGEATNSDIIYIISYHIKVITGNQPCSLDMNFQLKLDSNHGNPSNHLPLTSSDSHNGGVFPGVIGTAHRLEAPHQSQPRFPRATDRTGTEKKLKIGYHTELHVHPCPSCRLPCVFVCICSRRSSADSRLH